MIKRIEIADCASYAGSIEVMDGLQPVNFVYGPNGAGKTTVSRLIEDASTRPTCSVHWLGGTKMEPVVYNRDFIDANFNSTTNLKGIFTLGKKDIETQNKIDETKEEIDAITQKIEQLNQTLQGSDGIGGIQGKLEAVRSAFRDECWKVKTKHDARLQGALVGYRNDKQKFTDRLISECAKTGSPPPQLTELESKAASVFGPAPTLEQPLPELNDAAILAFENDPVLKKRILGKAEVDIAGMIQKLGNSDWVKQGIGFFEVNNGDCPFCQQKAPEQLTASLAEYFDEAFVSDTAEVAALKDRYNLEGLRIQQSVQVAIDSKSRFLDIEALKAEKAIFDSRFQLNQQRIENKSREPSQVVTLDSFSGVLASAKQLVSDANCKIQAHNSMVSNIGSEKLRLTNQVWAFLARVEIVSAFKKYETDRGNAQKAIDSLRAQISKALIEKTRKEEEIKTLEKSATSVKPTVNEINKILRGFGFRNFSIAATSENLYKICRGDGSDAKTTLSEGERSFLTFLYFYHLIKGSKSESGITSNRVVVFDDPVSSLDSDVLFIVGSLIREVIEEVRSGRGQIKQVFILTHNVYFHKEITFNKNRSAGAALKDETFWTIRKVSGSSKVKRHAKNPITTSYDLLWSEVREPNLASQTIQNTLRRILENYFRILGGISLDDVAASFDGEEKLICKSLLSWVNDGSHAIPDDVYIALDETVVNKYLEVFKKVFANLNQLSHYNMMMGGAIVLETVGPVVSPVTKAQ
jgi:wobble nucleotide-excising tRNase